MKASPFVVNWHNENSPIYACEFERHGKGRFATAGGDNNVRLWKLESHDEERKVVYLTTLVKHTQAVNVVRWCPRGEMLASAGDDGNVLLWVPSETNNHMPSFGEDSLEDKETWRVKHMCRSFGSEIYDLAWSPDGVFFITGSMDNIARIYNAQTGQTVRQIAEHNHYVQGVAWDPLNEFVATQSSDRSVHIYTLKTKDGQFTLAQHGKISKMDLPSRRTSSSSPAPPDLRPQFVNDTSSLASPIPSTPGTPTSLSLPMNPPVIAHSRRSSFSSSPSLRRSTSPAPSIPLPAVKPMELSPKMHTGLGVRNMYANETLISFFRRLAFTPDGSLLFTPAGQYKTSQPSTDGAKSADDVINTVYIYTRAGFNKPPIAHLPGHKKPSIAVRCSPVFYTHRRACNPTKHITIDTSSAEDTMPSLPEPAVPSRASTTNSEMEPPPIAATFPQPTYDSSATTSLPRTQDAENGSSVSGPLSAFALPYRIVYAVATQDAVLIYDTQQQRPICIVSNLHYATFTDLSWSSDGLTLIMSSSDGFCSAVTFTQGELGQVYTGQIPNAHHPSVLNTASSSTQSTPTPTPTSATAPVLNKIATSAASSRPLSPTRTLSASSIVTQLSIGVQSQLSSATITSNPTPTFGSVPSVAATNSGAVTGIPITTPPQTPLSGNSISAASSVSGASVLGKRDTTASESEKEDKIEQVPAKKRRVAPTLVSGNAPSGGAG